MSLRKEFRGFGPLSLLALALGCLALAGCVADDVSPSTGTSPLPALASYRCADQGQLELRRVAGGVQVTDTEGDTVTLPPAPPNQWTRYGMDGYALVVEGPTALWMKAGDTPLDCTRSGARSESDLS